jgi:hypothetical protein
MKAHGQQKSHQTFTCGPSDCRIACLCVLDVRGAADRPLSAQTLAEKENLRLSVEKNEWGLMQTTKRGFRGVFCSIWLD